jgi:hypothetical protein
MSNNETQVGTVDRVEPQGDRTLLYLKVNSRFEYHVISNPDQAKDINPGDDVRYEPGGFNFGWFASKVSEQEKSQVIKKKAEFIFSWLQRRLPGKYNLKGVEGFIRENDLSKENQWHILETIENQP